MFADGTVYFDVSYNTNFASNMVEKGVFANTQELLYLIKYNR